MRPTGIKRAKRHHTVADPRPMHDGLRSAASWFLYALGHLVSLPMVHWGMAFLYPVYNRLMVASAAAQRHPARGPWHDP